MTAKQTHELMLSLWNSNWLACEGTKDITTGDMQNIIIALEKQIPKKPVMIALDGFGFVQSSAVSCSTCGAAVINYYNRKFNPPHCIMCGQALDWGNTEKGGAQE